MRRIDLLPEAYAARRRERRDVAIAVVAGAVVLLLLVGWWVLLGFRINDANRELADVQARNLQLQEDINELQEFVELQNEVTAKRGALQTVMAGDVDWPSVLTEIAMVIPGEVWLTNLSASAGQTEGSTPVPTEQNPIPLSAQEPFGRMQFQGNSLSMSGVGKWMIRLREAKEFRALWLNSATETELESAEVVSFDTTLELGDVAASNRFQDGLP